MLKQMLKVFASDLCCMYRTETILFKSGWMYFIKIAESIVSPFLDIQLELQIVFTENSHTAMSTKTVS